MLSSPSENTGYLANIASVLSLSKSLHRTSMQMMRRINKEWHKHNACATLLHLGNRADAAPN